MNTPWVHVPNQPLLCSDSANQVADPVGTTGSLSYYPTAQITAIEEAVLDRVGQSQTTAIEVGS